VTEGGPASRELVSALWGDAAATGRLAEIHWMASPVVRAYLNRRVSGDPRTDWLSWLWHRYVRGHDLAVLVLGCGEGWVERALARRPEVASIDACDVAAGAVAAAAERARAEGLAGKIRYHVVDLDSEPLPGGPWDVAVAHSVLHHVARLEHCYAELSKGLRPGGLLLVNEYAGPRRFQFTPAQMRVIDGCLTRLPERLRLSTVTGGPCVAKQVPDEDLLAATDPSEAVRSDEVLPLLQRRFEVLAEHDAGGTVLHLLLYDLVQNFDSADPRENRILALLCLLEESLIDAGVLPSDFKVVAAGNRRPAPEPEGRAAAALLYEALRQGVRHPHRPPGALPSEVIHRAAAEGGNPPDVLAPPPVPAGRLRIHSRPLRDRRHGLDLQPVREALHIRAVGWPGSDWTTHALERFTPECGPGPTLVLDTPDGWLARRLVADPAAGEVDLLVPESQGRGGLRLEYRAHDEAGSVPADGRTEPAVAPPSSRYARAFTNGWLGRAPDRPALLVRLAAALRSGGLLIGDECTGPEDGRTTVSALRHARALLDLLPPPNATPPSRRRDRLVEFEHRLRERFGPPRRPLLDLLAPHFRLLDHRPQLGTLLQRVLAVAEPFLDPDDDRDAAFLCLLCYYEEVLTDAGVIPADYACFVAGRTGA
jgi:SAM-dependent methyltransferase